MQCRAISSCVVCTNVGGDIYVRLIGSEEMLDQAVWSADLWRGRMNNSQLAFAFPQNPITQYLLFNYPEENQTW